MQPPGAAADGRWQERALCRQIGDAVFYPEKGQPVQQAKRICAHCPVRIECLDYALAHDERFGVWGGMSERERRREARVRRREAG